MRIADACEVNGIDIIPEIDIPGHTVALRSWIENGDYQPEPMMGFKTEGLLRLSDLPKIIEIFEELVARFRVKKYIHMGGDETSRTTRPYFEEIVNTVCDWAQKRNLSVIAWEEVLGKVNDPPDNLIIQKWKPRTYPQIAQGLEKIGPNRIIYSNDYYLDTSPDPFTMFRKNTDKMGLGCIACSWGELTGMENIDGALYPSIAMLGAAWSNMCDLPEEALAMFYNEMIDVWSQSQCNQKTWRRKQWTGWMKGNNPELEPRSTYTPSDRPLDREDDLYPNCSKFLVDMTLDIYERMTGKSLNIPEENVRRYKEAFIEAGATKKLVDDLFNELRPTEPKIETVKTAMRRVQKSQEAEEQMYYKNGLRMVLRELIRI